MLMIVASASRDLALALRLWPWPQRDLALAKKLRPKVLWGYKNSPLTVVESSLVNCISISTSVIYLRWTNVMIIIIAFNCVYKSTQKKQNFITSIFYRKPLRYGSEMALALASGLWP